MVVTIRKPTTKRTKTGRIRQTKTSGKPQRTRTKLPPTSKQIIDITKLLKSVRLSNPTTPPNKPPTKSSSKKPSSRKIYKATRPGTGLQTKLPKPVAITTQSHLVKRKRSNVNVKRQVIHPVKNSRVVVKPNAKRLKMTQVTKILRKRNIPDKIREGTYDRLEVHGTGLVDLKTPHFVVEYPIYFSGQQGALAYRRPKMFFEKDLTYYAPGTKVPNYMVVGTGVVTHTFDIPKLETKPDELVPIQKLLTEKKDKTRLIVWTCKKENPVVAPRYSWIYKVNKLDDRVIRRLIKKNYTDYQFWYFVDDNCYGATKYLRRICLSSKYMRLIPGVETVWWKVSGANCTKELETFFTNNLDLYYVTLTRFLRYSHFTKVRARKSTKAIVPINDNLLLLAENMYNVKKASVADILKELSTPQRFTQRKKKTVVNPTSLSVAMAKSIAKALYVMFLEANKGKERSYIDFIAAIQGNQSINDGFRSELVNLFAVAGGSYTTTPVGRGANNINTKTSTVIKTNEIKNILAMV